MKLSTPMKPAFAPSAAPLTSPGGLTQAGGYMARQIDIKSRPRFQVPMQPAGVRQAGAPNDRLPKGLD